MAEEGVAPMRDEFPRWYRSVAMGDNHERLDARWKGIVSLVNAADESSIETMIALALRAKPRPSTESVLSIRKTFKAVDDLFDMEDNDRELEILCGTALVTNFEVGDETGVNRLPNLTLDRRPILTPLSDEFWR